MEPARLDIQRFQASFKSQTAGGLIPLGGLSVVMSPEWTLLMSQLLMTFLAENSDLQRILWELQPHLSLSKTLLRMSLIGVAQLFSSAGVLEF